MLADFSYRKRAAKARRLVVHDVRRHAMRQMHSSAGLFNAGVAAGELENDLQSARSEVTGNPANPAMASHGSLSKKTFTMGLLHAGNISSSSLSCSILLCCSFLLPTCSLHQHQTHPIAQCKFRTTTCTTKMDTSVKMSSFSNDAKNRATKGAMLIDGFSDSLPVAMVRHVG